MHKPTKISNNFISYAHCTYSHFLQFDPSLISGPPSILSLPLSPWLSHPHLPLVIDLQQMCCHYIMLTSPHYICLDRAAHLSHLSPHFHHICLDHTDYFLHAGNKHSHPTLTPTFSPSGYSPSPAPCPSPGTPPPCWPLRSTPSSQGPCPLWDH